MGVVLFDDDQNFDLATALARLRSALAYFSARAPWTVDVGSPAREWVATAAVVAGSIYEEPQ